MRADWLGIPSSGQVMVSEWERGVAPMPQRHWDALYHTKDQAA